jgi:hypothetical protein
MVMNDLSDAEKPANLPASAPAYALGEAAPLARLGGALSGTTPDSGLRRPVGFGRLLGLFGLLLGFAGHWGRLAALGEAREGRHARVHGGVVEFAAFMLWILTTTCDRFLLLATQWNPSSVAKLRSFGLRSA